MDCSVTLLATGVSWVALAPADGLSMTLRMSVALRRGLMWTICLMILVCSGGHAVRLYVHLLEAVRMRSMVSTRRSE